MGARQSSGIVPQLTSEVEAKGGSKISLNSENLSDQDVLDLSLFLKQAPTVTELRLKNCFVNQTGATHLATYLPETALSRLFLSCNIGMRDRGALPLIAALPSSTLQELSLDTTNITDRTARAIASVLPKCDLQTLYLGGNDISDVGASLLADALPRSKVTKLYLSSSKIRDLGARSLGDAMKKHPLKALTLAANYISDVGAKFLAEGLASCLTLQKLDLSCNDLTDDSVRFFLAAVERHPSITKVCVQYTATSANIVQELELKLACLHSNKAKVLTMLCYCAMSEIPGRAKGNDESPIGLLPLELVRYLSSMLYDPTQTPSLRPAGRVNWQ